MTNMKYNTKRNFSVGIFDPSLVNIPNIYLFYVCINNKNTIYMTLL